MNRIVSLMFCVGLALSTMGCPYRENGHIETFNNTGDILFSITRSDGSTLPNLIEYLETRYGVRVQTMSVVIPTLSFFLTSSIDETDPVRFSADAAVTGWETPVYDIVNDVQAVPFRYEVRSGNFETCSDGNCNIWGLISEYIEFFEGMVRTHLPEHLRLRLVGINPVTEASQVLELEPSYLDYQCQFDVGTGFMRGTHCAGEAHFVVE